MKPSLKTAATTLLIMCLPAVATAELLGVQIEQPSLDYNSGGTTTYDGTNGQLEVMAVPVTFLPHPGADPLFVFGLTVTHQVLVKVSQCSRADFVDAALRPMPVSEIDQTAFKVDISPATALTASSLKQFLAQELIYLRTEGPCVVFRWILSKPLRQTGNANPVALSRQLADGQSLLAQVASFLDCRTFFEVICLAPAIRPKREIAC